MSGTIGSSDRANWQKHGMVRSAGMTDGLNWSLNAQPNGFYAGGAWVLPRTAGAMTARATAILTIDASPLNLAAGRNLDGSATLTIDCPDAQLQLVVSATGSATLTISASGSMAGALQAAGSASLSINLTDATLGALVGALGVANISITPAGTLTAIGYLSGTTEDSTVLTPAAIAQAVGERIIEAGYTFDEVIRIIAAYAAGSATGLEGSDPQFKGLDGVTTRIDGGYAAGTRTIDALNGA